MCWNAVHWFMQTDDENLLDIPVDDERLRINKRRCWANDAYEFIRSNQLRRTVDKHDPVKRTKADVDRKREDKKENIKKQVKLQIENQHGFPDKDSDEIAAAKAQCLHNTKNHRGYMWDVTLSDTIRHEFHVFPRTNK